MEQAHNFFTFISIFFVFKQASESEDQGMNLVWPYLAFKTNKNTNLHNSFYNSVIYVPHRRGGGHIVFGADPVGVSVGLILSYLHDIS